METNSRVVEKSGENAESLWKTLDIFEITTKF